MIRLVEKVCYDIVQLLTYDRKFAIQIQSPNIYSIAAHIVCIIRLIDLIGFSI